jgi:hypothetical protein
MMSVIGTLSATGSLNRDMLTVNFTLDVMNRVLEQSQQAPDIQVPVSGFNS